MAALPYMPLFVADYLADTAHLTAVQHGAYLLLIMNYWQRGGPLPNDDVKLARIARMSKRDWARNRDEILEFFSIQENTLHHSRIDDELARVEAKSLKCRDAALANAKRTQSKRPSNAKRTQSHTQAHTDTDLSSNEDVSAEPTAKPLTKREVIDAWQERMVPQGFPAIRKMTGQRERQLAARLRDSTLDEWLQAMAALERSAFCRGENDRGWRADFDFLLQPKSFTKLLEGAYDY